MEATHSDVHVLLEKDGPFYGKSIIFFTRNVLRFCAMALQLKNKHR